MFDFAAVYNHDSEQSIRGIANGSKQNAVVLAFPYPLPKSNVDYAPMTAETDIIGHRMQAPLNSNELTALVGMLKRHAKGLGQQLWVTTGAFLAAMGVEELGDLRRCDFVRAVNYLVPSDVAAQV